MPVPPIIVSFVYGIKNNIHYDFIEGITDTYNGIMFRMWDGIDEITMIDKLSTFFNFVAEGVKGQRKPHWSEVY